MSKTEIIKEHVHRRYNPLKGEWILVSPHRTKRPWQGQQEKPGVYQRPEYDPNCYLCPGNERAGGHHNPEYKDTFVFTNDFAAMLPDGPEELIGGDSLMKSELVRGTCRVICYSPNHSQSMADMKPEGIEKVVRLWIDQLKELNCEYRWVQIFENKGAVMGCSNPHPHGQIWASSHLPNEIKSEDLHQNLFYKSNASVLLKRYLEEELKQGDRILLENESWVSLVPYWAVWPFETLLLPKRHITRLDLINKNEQKDLAGILKKHLTMYDRLFRVSFPYTMGWHGAPENDPHYNHWQLHAHFYPPLLRSATVKKFMVGYEMLAEAQRDISAEQAADRLRSLLKIKQKI